MYFSLRLIDVFFDALSESEISFWWSHLDLEVYLIASIINSTHKGVRLSEKLQLTAVLVMKVDCSNKSDLCYYGQVNSLRLKSNAASIWASKHLWTTIYFAADGTYR